MRSQSEMSNEKLDFPTGYPEILADMAGLIHARLIDLAVPKAAAIATALVEDIRRKWGGGLVYIPKGAMYTKQQRDDEVLRAFNGKNQAELARRFNVSISCIYDILTKKRSFSAANRKNASDGVKVKHDNEFS